MGETTKIQWCDHTFNPWRGCATISSGCQHCYAEQQAKRNPAVLGEWGPEGRRVVCAESGWRAVLRWDRDAAKEDIRRRVFCGSMMDVFEDRRELDTPRARLLRTIAATPNLDWLLLTKRPASIEACLGCLFATDFEGRLYKSLGLLKSIWLGYSASTQADLDRGSPYLLKCPAAVRFLSLEPLLESLHILPYIGGTAHRCKCGWHETERDILPHGRRWRCPQCESWCQDFPGIDWVIVGGESGPKARPCNVAWVRSVVAQCQAAGVAVFVKQLGSRIVVRNDSASEWPREGDEWIDLARGHRPAYQGEPMEIRISDPKGGDPNEWPEDLRVREFPEPRTGGQP